MQTTYAKRNKAVTAPMETIAPTTPATQRPVNASTVCSKTEQHVTTTIAAPTMTAVQETHAAEPLWDATTEFHVPTMLATL
jgi:hypothetical protein